MEDIQSLTKALAADPANWDDRQALAAKHIEAGDPGAAAQIVSEAPEIPGDESAVLFASQTLAAVDPSVGLGLLDSYLEGTPDSAAALELKASIESGDDEPAMAVLVEESTPIAPVALKPPGADDDGDADADVAQVAEVDNEEIAEAEVAGRSFIVADGEAVKGAEKEPDAKSKVSALTAAILVHAIIIVLAGIVTVATSRPKPPQITVSSIGPADADAMQNQTMQKKQRKTASQVTAAQPVVNVQSFSSVSLPDITVTSTDMSMVAMASDAGTFGLSMDGIGEVSNMGAIPASMQSRCSMSQRMQRLRESGGEDRAEKAVRDALSWITAQQNEDGSMGKTYKAAMTGLSLLAYLGHCETPESPKFGDSVVNATLYLIDRAREGDGYTYNGEKGHHQAYEHAIATYALAELYTMTKESGREVPRLESTLKKMVDVIVDGQRKEGGWDYDYKTNGSSSDMSVSGWQVQALKAAYNTGKSFSGVEKALDDAIEDYFPAIQDSRGAFKYRPDNAEGKATLTGAALLGMQIWKAEGTPEYKKGLEFLNSQYLGKPPTGSGRSFYDDYYNTQVYFLHGGDEWEKYNAPFQKALLDQQRPDGSWGNPDGNDPKQADNQLMGTAWACLQLEVYYRYLPTTDKVQGLQKR